MQSLAKPNHLPTQFDERDVPDAERFRAALLEAFDRHGLVVSRCNLTGALRGRLTEVRVETTGGLIVFGVSAECLENGTFDAVIDDGVGKL